MTMNQVTLRWEHGAMLALLLALVILAWSPREFKETFASAFQGNDYYSTTTMAVFNGTFDGVEVLKTGQGALAQVAITGAATGNLVFYDATTTDVTKRATTQSTTTITIADLAASVAAGTYTFDAQFTRGLIMTRLSGSGPTSTVMWR